MTGTLRGARGNEMALWLFVLALAIYADHVYRVRASTLIRKHQFRLYGLRDELREAAIRGISIHGAGCFSIWIARSPRPSRISAD